MNRALALLLALALAGCLRGDGEGGRERYVVVDPPEDGGGFAPCAPSDAQPLAVPFRADAVQETGGLGPGLHRLDARTFLWVWAVLNDSQRQDRITRLNEVQVFAEPDGMLDVCTRVEVAAPQEVDGERRSYAVAARFVATQGLPEGPVRVVVNWVAGCLCDPLPRGNATAVFS